MDLPFRIENRDSFRVVGSMIRTTNKKGEGRKAIPRHWSEIKKDSMEQTLMELSDQEPQGLFGINIYNTDKTDSRIFNYMIAVSSSRDAEDGFTEYIVPAMTWAVFPCTAETIGKTEAQAITKWLPKSKYKPLNKGYITGRMKSGAPDIEYYGQGGYAEVWIGVKEKTN
ncbi:GyrI-like domain-containing protein [Anaerostipes sp.]|uniref:GyrI-like domain-containing protein n=1 Tax=Anaerostipes sp. TaxID=1872530 RepID=UPI0025BEE3D7|nr:GyrI-like domain-containing protein [Anaerostipes sp.]MBS7008678.1 effector binding domain-containing protein [Anaerostipes sp.]